MCFCKNLVNFCAIQKQQSGLRNAEKNDGDASLFRRLDHVAQIIMGFIDGYFPYNTQTGKRLKEMYCPNTKCERGCGENGGHQFNFWGVGNKCQRCGYRYSGGYSE